MAKSDDGERSGKIGRHDVVASTVLAAINVHPSISQPQ
jgi:hypothetical protein